MAVADYAAQADISFGEIHEFPTSSSHSVFAIAETTRGQVLVKVALDLAFAGGESALLNEFRTMTIAASAGLAPRALHVDVRRRVVISDFVRGEECTGWGNENLRLCVDLSSRLASLNGVGVGTDHLSYSLDLRRANDLFEEGRPSADERRLIGKLLVAVRDRLLPLQPLLDQLPHVLSHNDISPENVLIDLGGRPLLIDFETAAICPVDFLYGQLAVDAYIEDCLSSQTLRPFAEVWGIVDEVAVTTVGDELKFGRVLERLYFNYAYAHRQVGRADAGDFSQDYVTKKSNVAEICLAALTELVHAGRAGWRL